MWQTPFWPQTEITPEYTNLNTILALVRERQKKAIPASGQVGDFGLPCATQFPGGGEA